jgi:flagellar hook-associated protein 2
MAGLSSPGIGSGLDVSGIVTQLMTLEQRPIAGLNTREAGFQAKLTAYGSLKGLLSSVQSTAKALTLATTFTSRTAAVSDATVLAASAEPTAAVGSYVVAVTQLAKFHAVRSDTNYAATTDTFNTGTLAIKVGAGDTVNVTIDSNNNTLAGIRQAINDAGAGVTASIVNDGSTNRLLLTSKTLGSSGAITATATDSGSGGTHALTGLDSSVLVATQAADDAEFSVNGFEVTRSSNTIGDVVEGLTLNLTKVGSSNVTISVNTGATTAAINGFVKSYNDTVKQLQSASAYNAATKVASVLTGDSTARSISTQMRTLAQSTVLDVGGGIATLSSIGIALQKDGTLLVDSTKLAAALADPAKDVAALFATTTVGNQGIAVRFNNAMEGIIGSTGLIASRTEGIAASIKDISKRREAITLRLTKIEARYRAQFTALDGLIAGMNKTSEFLTQQLANLPVNSSN